MRVREPAEQVLNVRQVSCMGNGERVEQEKRGERERETG